MTTDWQPKWPESSAGVRTVSSRAHPLPLPSGAVRKRGEWEKLNSTPKTGIGFRDIDEIAS
jgi:hypothetical protein